MLFWCIRKHSCFPQGRACRCSPADPPSHSNPTSLVCLWKENKKKATKQQRHEWAVATKALGSHQIPQTSSTPPALPAAAPERLPAGAAYHQALRLHHRTRGTLLSSHQVSSQAANWTPSSSYCHLPPPTLPGNAASCGNFVWRKKNWKKTPPENQISWIMDVASSWQTPRGVLRLPSHIAAVEVCH